MGAGPYGLSMAAQLARHNADFRVFGKPMDTWRNHMPKGMFLKSDGFASNLCAPGDSHNHNLSNFCAQNGVAYDDVAIPVGLETFINYACDFQRRFVPSIDERTVVGLRSHNGRFELMLDNDETICARQVILAVGITHFAYVPNVLAAGPTELVSHSNDHHNLDCFANRDVTIVGAGASAVDLSALLHEAGSKVRLVARNSAIRFGSVPNKSGRSRWQRIRHPQSGLGPGVRSRLACDLPDLFRCLPGQLRLQIVRRHLGPASAWHLAPRVLGRVSIMVRHRVTKAEVRGNQIELSVESADGRSTTVRTDHVIAATGYHVDISRLRFVDEALRAHIRTVGSMPVLTKHFESSVPGLYFLGLAAAGSFGPLLRFVYGCEFAVRRVTNHVMGRG